MTSDGDNVGFLDRLEAHARRLVRVQNRTSDDDVRMGTVREIQLILAQIDAWRDSESRLQRGLLRIELYTNTELMQMEQRTPPYSPDRYPEREKLQRLLLDVEKDRRRLDVQHTRTVCELWNRLFTLVERYTQLDAGP